MKKETMFQNLYNAVSRINTKLMPPNQWYGVGKCKGGADIAFCDSTKKTDPIIAVISFTKKGEYFLAGWDKPKKLALLKARLGINGINLNSDIIKVFE